MRISLEWTPWTVVFSSDGKEFAVAGGQGTALFDSQTGKEVSRTGQGQFVEWGGRLAPPITYGRISASCSHG